VTAWLDDSELRIGLGCMRLSTADERDEALGVATIGAAAAAGITVFDTAHAYGLNASELGHNEQLLARALRRSGAEAQARIVTKGGMARPAGAWLPDGRARTIRTDCEASLEALDGLPIDLYLVHAPDPRTPWRTTVRALARLAEEGLVRAVGLSNVNRAQLDEALEHAPVRAVEVGVSLLDDKALRGGVLDRCAELGLALIAHSPLGGPGRARRLARHDALRAVAEPRRATPAEIALAWLLDLSPVLVAIPGARHPEAARSAAGAAQIRLEPEERAALAQAFAAPSPRRRRGGTRVGDVVVVMGIPGAGKSRVAADYVARGYQRLNRDERGGSLREVAAELDRSLGTGMRRVVLDNTYLSRAARSFVVEATARHDVAARCLWLDTPLAQAQVNLVERLLERLGSLPSPEELRARARQPGLVAPTSQMRALRELEEPALDEGFAAVERIPFVRGPAAGREAAGVLVAAAALTRPGWEAALDGCDADAPHLLFDWRPGGTLEGLVALAEALTRRVRGRVETALCPHPPGPPSCWCRPPLPGLAVAFASRHGVDLARSTLVGTSTAHRTLATTLGARAILV
jgi:aryl-alcohol dehydrogenase-like predicted oxidoreductase